MLYNCFYKTYLYFCNLLCKEEVICNIKPCCSVIVPSLTNECIICRDYLYNTDTCVYRICYQCNNIYHKHCYEQWMYNCPNCRNKKTSWYYTIIPSQFIYCIGKTFHMYKMYICCKD